MDFTPLPKSAWPTTSSRGFFFWESAQPTKSLVGSVIDYRSDRYETTATYLVHCPSPCDENFPDQTLTHARGSSFAGQYVEAKTTTTWNCKLGAHQGEEETNYGVCVIASGNPVNTKEASTTTLGYCDVLGHTQSVTFTAGLDKIFSVNPPAQTGDRPGNLARDHQPTGEKELTCPPKTKGGHGTAGATQTSESGSTAASTGPKETGAQTTQAPSGTQASGTQASGTQGSAQTSSTKSGAEGSGARRGILLLLGSALMGAFLSI